MKIERAALPSFLGIDGVWVLLSCLTLVRLVYIGFAPVTAQEAYYWLYAQNPALSYVDHPPSIAYSILLGTSLFGDSGFGIKFMAVVWSLLTNILLYVTACRLCSGVPGYQAKYTATIAVLIYNLTLFSHVFAVIHQPDSSLLFFWLLVLYFVQEFQLTGRNRNFIFAGIALGFALLCKYTAIAIVPGVLIAILCDPKLRKSLFTVYPYLALMIALIVFSPVIVWNADHDWISFRMQFNDRAAKAAGGNMIHYKYILQLLGTQLAMLTPLIFVLAIKSCLKMAMEWRRHRVVRLQFLSGAVLIVGFTFISLTSKVKLHWLLPGYLGIIVCIVILFNAVEITRSKWVKSGVGFSLVLILVCHILFVLPGFQIFQVNSWSGWRQFSEQVIELQREVGGPNKVFIFTDSHKTAAYITLYSPNHQRTYAQNVIGGFSKQLSVWGVPESLKGMDGLYISRHSKLSPTEQDLLKQFFDDIVLVATFSYPLLSVGDKPTREIYCFLGKNYTRHLL